MPKDNANDKTYQELTTELDETMLKLQASELDVDQAVELYETGLALVKQLEEKLASAENKITKLKASANPEA